MRAVLSWIDKVQDDEDKKQPIHALAFKPDATELVVAAGSRVLVYDAAEGSQIHALRGHKDSVYTVDYAPTGGRFASGSADKSVIIWTDTYEGVLKFSHNDAIQALAFNPQSSLLVSCAITDFGLWSADEKSVNKHKIPSRVTSCAWTPDGSAFALGELLDPSDENGEYVPVLAVSDWNRTLAFYTTEGDQVSLSTELPYDPCCMDFFTIGEYLVIGGANRRLDIHTKTGTRLGTVCETQSWIWCCKTKPGSQFVVVGCEDGNVACYQLVFSTVHGLHKDSYAFRDSMTDVCVQQLLKDKQSPFLFY